jgi:predicted methyltransferase
MAHMNRHTRSRGWLIGAAVALALVAPASAQDAQRAQHETRRDEWQKVDAIFAAMGIKSGSVVADVGAGGGYFTARLSKAVGEAGRVYALDIDPGALRRLKARVDSEKLTNVETVETAADDPRLPPGSIDAALIVNAYHEMASHQAMLTKIKAALRPGGRLVIVEPISASRRSSARDVQTRSHEIAPEFVRQDVREAGFTQVQLVDPLTVRPDGNEDEWMLVVTPQSAAAAAWSSTAREDWQSPSLRITPEEFKKLTATSVLVLDVRDAEMYRGGHLPGAVLMTVEELMTSAATAKLAGERRLIVTYCS